jgi:predicted Zn finger-like uncharacterized protein
MYTQCPKCNKTLLISVQQLRNGRGLLNCPNCSTHFDTLERLSETPLKQTSTAAVEQTLPWDQHIKTTAPVIWRMSLAAGVVLLIVQAYYFERNSFFQNTLLRPWMEKTCQEFGCQLPVYQNLNELTILQGSFQPYSENSYRLQALFTNQAPFAQPYPQIKLTLLKFDGTTLAVRVFKPSEYFPDFNNALVAAEASIDIDLLIARPEELVGGYTLELI